MLARPTAAHAVTMIRPLESLAAALSLSAAAIAQPCHPGPRLFETDHAAYEAQARRVFAALISAAMRPAGNWQPMRRFAPQKSS
jgi:hypothetical protein